MGIIFWTTDETVRLTQDVGIRASSRQGGCRVLAARGRCCCCCCSIAIHASLLQQALVALECGQARERRPPVLRSCRPVVLLPANHAKHACAAVRCGECCYPPCCCWACCFCCLCCLCCTCWLACCCWGCCLAPATDATQPRLVLPALQPEPPPFARGALHVLLMSSLAPAAALVVAAVAAASARWRTTKLRFQSIMYVGVVAGG